MTDTPARDALRKRLYVQTGAPVPVSRHNVDRTLASVLNNPALVIAALVESGWRPDDDQLRTMGGTRQGTVGVLGIKREWHFPRTEEADDA